MSDQRTITYCVVAGDLVEELHEPLRRHWREDPSIEVIVERRASDRRRFDAAAPRSTEPGELARSLRATAELYDAALDRWAERTGRPRPRHPLAPGALARIRSAR